MGATTAAKPSTPRFVPDPQKQVLVIMYHQVTDTPIGVTAGEGHYGPAVSPRRFDADLSYLARNGFAPADPQAALRYLTGSADASGLPDHSYLITFDDGFESAWTNATKILAAHHVKAIMFVEGARTGITRGRLSAREIRAMARSGTWQIESHGFAGHSLLRVGPNPGDLSPYWYANLAWLAGARRFETRAEYEVRVRADLAHSKAFLEGLTKTPVTAFAYPSGEYGQSIAVPPGGDPATIGADQGHSNASGLTPLLFEALRGAGFSSAFAVVVPGSEAAASPGYLRYTFPRIGGSPQVYSQSILTLADGELRLPAISPDYHWLDCQATGASAGDVWVASSVAPFIYSLDDVTGRVVRTVEVPALEAGREGQPTLVAGLVVRLGGSIVAYEQAGSWPGGRPRLVSFRLTADSVTDVRIVNLQDAANWLVGIADAGNHLVGLTDGGQVLALDGAHVRKVFALHDGWPGWNVDGVGRFTGLAYAGGLLYLVDRKDGQLLGLAPSSGALRDREPLPQGADIRAIGGDDGYLWLVDYAQNRRSLFRLKRQ